jgi:hypothetical protein
MKSRFHALAGIAATALVATFMTATIIVEVIIREKAAILGVKTAILFALIILIPCVMIAGGTGRSLAVGRTSPLLKAKKRRATLIAVIGITVLVPCAITLRILAADARIGPAFIVVQAIELAGGTVNLTLLIRNARAGRLLTAARRRRRNAQRVTLEPERHSAPAEATAAPPQTRGS